MRQVVVPTEQISEMKDGQKIQTEKRTMPGYVLVNMEMTDDSWGLVKNTPGVTGFVGSRNKPIPLSKVEVDRLLHRETAERPRTRAQFSIGESVKVISGPAGRLLRRDRRDQRGRRQAQGAGLDLRPRDAGRGQLRPGQEDLMTEHLTSCDGQEGPDTDQAADPGRRGQPGAAGRPRAGPARRQHHGVLQGVQRADPAGRRHDHPGRDHGLRGPQLRLHHQDPARRGPDQGGRRDRQGLRRAAHREGRLDHRRPGPPDRRAQDARPERQRPRRRDQDHRRHRPLDGRDRRGPPRPRHVSSPEEIAAARAEAAASAEAAAPAKAAAPAEADAGAARRASDGQGQALQGGLRPDRPHQGLRARRGGQPDQGRPPAPSSTRRSSSTSGSASTSATPRSSCAARSPSRAAWART